MRITIVTPAGPGSRGGNRATAERWAGFLRRVGHRIAVEEEWDGEPVEVMIALHARRSHPSIEAFAEAFPERPLVVVLTGTDLYRDIRTDTDAKESLELADRLVVLQEAGLAELGERHRAKTWIIYQSAEPIAPEPTSERYFDVCVVGHLRAEKDPFRAALATRLFPGSSRIRVMQAGGALDADHARQARELTASVPRYRWLGEISHQETRRLMARCQLLVQSSVMEGGANVVSEALAAGLPVLAADIPGNVGMLGTDYPGYYPTGDEHALARLLARAENDADFYEELKTRCSARRYLVLPERESGALEWLVREVSERARPRHNARGTLDYTRGMSERAH